MLGSFLLIETAINRILPFDARTPKWLETLQGEKLLVEITDLQLKIYMTFSTEGIHFLQTSLDPLEDQPDLVRVTGPLASFLSLARTKDPYAASRLGLVVEGDVETAEQIQSFFLGLQIDWEEIVSKVTGDVAAHQLFKLIKQGRQRQKETIDNVSYALGEYLKEEVRWLPTRTEIDEFLDGVDVLILETERLEARLGIIVHSTTEQPSLQNNSKCRPRQRV